MAILDNEQEKIAMVAEYMQEWLGVIEKVYASRFCKYQLLYAPVPPEWKGWSRPEAAPRAAKDFFSIDLAGGQYGFFSRRSALTAEAHYFSELLPWFQWEEGEGLKSPVSWQKWQESLERRGAEIKPQNIPIYDFHSTYDGF